MASKSLNHQSSGHRSEAARRSEILVIDVLCKSRNRPRSQTWKNLEREGSVFQAAFGVRVVCKA